MRNTDSVEEWEGTQMCELIFRNIVCNNSFYYSFFLRWDLHWLLTFDSVFFQVSKQKDRLPYISMLLQYPCTNDIWHPWKTRKLRPTFLVHLLLLYSLEEQLVTALSCCYSTSPSFWICLYVRGLINAWLPENLCRIPGLPSSPVSFVHEGVTSPASIHFN